MTSSDRESFDPHAADPVIDPAAALTRLARSLEALVAIDTEQQTLFPEDQSDPGALAAEFDRSLATVQRLAGVSVTSEQSAALERLSEQLLLMSRDGAEFDADLWTDRAVTTSAHWRDVRALAAAALETLRQT